MKVTKEKLEADALEGIQKALAHQGTNEQKVAIIDKIISLYKRAVKRLEWKADEDFEAFISSSGIYSNPLSLIEDSE